MKELLNLLEDVNVKININKEADNICPICTMNGIDTKQK